MAHPVPPTAAAAAVPPTADAAGVPPAPPDGATVLPRAYREELYADAARNPAPERVAGFLAGFCFGGKEDIPTPVQLRDQAVALSDRQPMAFFLRLITGPDGTLEVSVVVHRLLRYVDTPGGARSHGLQ